MRIDHHAYQRAARVASFGLLLQFVIGLILLVFGLNLNDTAFVFGSMYTLSGLVVWLGLIVIFYQHKLECLEALEEDELASSRGSSAISMFEKQDDELHVAARRLRMMHKWLMPIASLALAALLGLRLEPAQEACEGTGAQVANVNSAEQIVIGGPTS
ncbi:MAG: hypothetical protein IH891_02880, partial [Planctomycetes bacterium]|nr:hypothetical protein [Planctomycetota bacterium]